MFLKTLELPNLNNQNKISCIPADEYIIKTWKSPKFGNCIKIFDINAKDEVKNRSNILIHSGNSVANFIDENRTKRTCESEGCILIGTISHKLVDENDEEHCLLFESRKALDLLCQYMKRSCNGLEKLKIESLLTKKENMKEV